MMSLLRSTSRSTSRSPSPRPSRQALAAALLGAALAAPATGVAQDRTRAVTVPAADQRVGLAPGLHDAGIAIRNLEVVSLTPKPAGFFNPADPGDVNFWNSDLGFQKSLVFQGGWNGVQVWDIANPAKPVLRASIPCATGQGDVSVYGTLLFVSAQETRDRIDCGTQGVPEEVSAERFRGVRIFDIRDLDRPVQVAAVQTCRGSHTHTLVPHPSDPRTMYVYVQGTSPVRPAEELAGCSGAGPEDPNTSLFRIEIIAVPLDRPQDAAVVNQPRIFADSTGRVDGLWKGGDHGEGTQRTRVTNQCHDITAYPALGLAAGACSGNGILLDIRDPANPKRVAAVEDPNFAYWHSATFNNDGTSLLFTDEWGGGTQPRCRATDRPEWGANAQFRLDGTTLTFASYYKMPAPQSATENCVAHNGSLIPVPGRDLFVQSWYQGGISVTDFTDPAKPFEVAYFDRGPISKDTLHVGGQWSTYWYNGLIIGSEIARGLDILRPTPNELLTANELEAASLARLEEFNPQMQPKFTWPAHFAVARAYLDQLVRDQGLPAARTKVVGDFLRRAERERGNGRKKTLSALADQLDKDVADAKDARRVKLLAGVVRELAAP